MGSKPSSWRQLYTGTVRVVALWGAEIGWRGQRGWKKDFERLQYQALRKCTGGVIGSDMLTVNMLAGVEDVETILHAGQARYMARCIGNSQTTRDVWETAQTSVRGRHWSDFGIYWMQQILTKGKDGVESIANRMLSVLEVEEGERIRED